MTAMHTNATLGVWGHTPPALQRAPYERPTMSASRLKAIGGEKGSPGCERKLAAAYLFNLKQAETDALRRGSALHEAAEVLQATGEIPDPESEVGRILRSGAHLISQCGDLLVEYEHVGTLPDGSPYVAYLDGHTEFPSQQTGTVIIQDLKTTGNPAFALTAGNGEYGLLRDIQVMFYNWILLCDVHYFCPPLPDGHYGPKHWRLWDPVARHARCARDRWLYFLTRGVPRAWEVTDFCLPETAAAFMKDNILPLVQKINWIHEYHYAHPGMSLDEFDRNFNACQRKQKWCGAGEAKACDFTALGTPIIDLIQLRVRPKLTPQERLANLKRGCGSANPQQLDEVSPASATLVDTQPESDPPTMTPQERIDALKKNVAAGVATGVPAAAAAIVAAATPAPEPQPAPKAEPSVTETPAAASTNDSAPAAVAVVDPAPKRRGRPPKAPAAPPGAGINPPEAVEALAAVNAAVEATPAVSPTPPPVVEGETSEDALLALVARLQVFGINPSVVINVQVKR